MTILVSISANTSRKSNTSPPGSRAIDRTLGLHYLDIAAEDEPGAVGGHGVLDALDQDVAVADQR